MSEEVDRDPSDFKGRLQAIEDELRANACATRLTTPVEPISFLPHPFWHPAIALPAREVAHKGKFGRFLERGYFRFGLD